MDKPTGMKDSHLEYLDQLRKSGRTNMWGAVPYMEDELGLDKKLAGKIHSYWMNTFEERHPTKGG